MDLTAVRQGLAANAATIAGLNCFAYLPESIPEPCFAVVSADLDYHQTFGGDDAAVFTCRLLVGRAVDAAAQETLDGYLSSGSPGCVRAAIEATPTLGGACDDLVVLQVRSHRLYTIGTDIYLGAELTVRVIE